MKTKDSFKSKVPKVKIDKSLDQYKGKVLFPKKLEMANKMLKAYGLPKDIEKHS